MHFLNRSKLIALSLFLSSSLFCSPTALIQEGDQMEYLLKAKIEWEEPNKEISISVPIVLQAKKSNENEVLFTLLPKLIHYSYFFKSTLIRYKKEDKKKDGERTITLMPEVIYVPIHETANLEGEQGALLIKNKIEGSYLKVQEIIDALVESSARRYALSQSKAAIIQAVERSLAPLIYLSFSLYTGRIDPSKVSDDHLQFTHTAKNNQLFISQSITTPLDLTSRCRFELDWSPDPNTISFELSPLNAASTEIHDEAIN